MVDMTCEMCQPNKIQACQRLNCGYVLLVPLSCLFSLVNEAPNPKSSEVNVKFNESSPSGFVLTTNESSRTKKVPDLFSLLHSFGT